jgi:hypothetical protein
MTLLKVEDELLRRFFDKSIFPQNWFDAEVKVILEIMANLASGIWETPDGSISKRQIALLNLTIGFIAGEARQDKVSFKELCTRIEAVI